MRRRAPAGQVSELRRKIRAQTRAAPGGSAPIPGDRRTYVQAPALPIAGAALRQEAGIAGIGIGQAGLAQHLVLVTANGWVDFVRRYDAGV